MAYSLPIKYYNSFLLKKTQENASPNYYSKWPGLPWNPSISPYDGTSLGSLAYKTFPFDSGTFRANQYSWYVEEARIKGGFNNTSIDFGVRAYVVEENNKQNDNFSTLIFSGVYNSETGTNNTNVFSIGEKITKQINPANGSIQKLYSSDTNLIVFQESKVSKILINKNTIYSGSQGAQESAKALVLGQVYPYSGKYGISQHPESFAVFSNRKYFSDQNQGLVCRLSNDGITEINRYGMRDYFRDYFSTVSTNWQSFLYNQNISLTLDADGNLTQPTVSGDVACNFTIGSSIYLDNQVVVANNAASNRVQVGSNIYLRDIKSPTQAGIISTFSITTQGSGYSAGASGTTGGSSVSNIDVTLTVDGTGGILTAVPNAPEGFPGYKVGDVLNVITGGTSGTITVASVVNETQFFFNLQPRFWSPQPAFGATTSYNFGFETQKKGRIFGGWDIHADNYVISIQPNNGNNTFSTISFDESSNGWTSRHSYKPQFINSMRDSVYTTNQNSLWRHYDNTTENNRTSYYGIMYSSSIELIINQNPSLSKNFLTVGYEGSSGWKVDYFKSDFEGFDYSYYTTPVGGFDQSQDTIDTVLSYLSGRYEVANPNNVGLLAVTPPFEYAGFKRKENKYLSNLKNNSQARPGEVIFGQSVSGIKGYFSTVKLSTDNITQVGGEKELFLVSSTFTPSSY
jgi:hypothetical protein|tara:strand:- start:2027 stop:4081 length:2055 start_codon:yes stop_codon:yes gene_type:complete